LENPKTPSISASRSGPMDRKKTWTQLDRTILGPDHWSWLHHLSLAAGCGP
jgi:hypothetical protein